MNAVHEPARNVAVAWTMGLCVSRRVRHALPPPGLTFWIYHAVPDETWQAIRRWLARR